MLETKLPKKPKWFRCPAGDRKKPVYKYVYDEKYGCPRRVLNGYSDWFDYIQASADDVDFKSIGKMLVDNRNNVVSHFISKDGEVFDATGLPRNIHEVNALHNKMMDSFNNLDPEIKVLFNNDFEVFRKAYKHGNLAAMLQPKTETVVEKKEGEE